ncbi:MAG TPA: helix-turn-helix domain-containing protein [Syntrophales bacterium]|nr:helix-turn-helix domain-containing protein [Syntrophales bacterium]
MKKFSIVKRRREEALPFGGRPSGIGTQVLAERELIEVPSSVLKISSNKMEKETYTLDESDEDIDETISIDLTPDQYELVKSSSYVKYFLNGESSGVSLDINKQKDGQIIFNFQFRKVETVKMLKTDHVCQMLQISKSSLMNLVNSKKIKSYKIGRLRRFLLQDILDYLSRSEEFVASSKV